MAGNGKVFVSHAHADNAMCDRYVQALRARGLDVWYDRQDMQAGNTLTDVIERELQARSNFVVILTPAAVNSYWVQMEIAAFRDLAAHDRSRLILPVRAGNCEIPLLLRGLKWVDAARMDFDSAIKEIVAALHGAPTFVSQAATMPPRGNPFARLFGRGAPSSSSASAIVVDAKGKRGSYRTIGAAIAAASAGATILVRPGTYRESLSIEKPVELKGDGRREEIVIETNTEETTIKIETLGLVRLATLTIRHNNNDATESAIDISGGQVEIENCAITSRGFRNIGVATSGSEAVVRKCRIQSEDETSNCLDIGRQARATLEDNEIVGGGGGMGISIVGGQVVARRNRITKLSTAVWIQSGGGGAFEGNNLRGNFESWNIRSDAGTVARSGNLD